VELALRKLREQNLEAAYREASAETDPAWNEANSDGLGDETW
jgi:hypothetical protein